MEGLQGELNNALRIAEGWAVPAGAQFENTQYPGYVRAWLEKADACKKALESWNELTRKYNPLVHEVLVKDRLHPELTDDQDEKVAKLFTNYPILKG